MAKMSDYTLYKEVWPPSILNITFGQSFGPSEDFDVQLSPYHSRNNTGQAATQVQISSSPDFSSIDYDDTVNSTTDTVFVTSWSRNMDSYYYVRGRYKDNNGVWSNWSYIIKIYIYEIYIEAPTITSPSDGAVDIGETPTFTTDAFNCVNGTDTHQSSSYWLYKNSDDTLVWSSVDDVSNLTSITLPGGNHQTSTEYRLEAVHTGSTYGDSAVSSITYTTASSFWPEDGPPQSEYVDNDYSSIDGLDVYALDYDITTDTGYYGVATSAEVCDGPTLASDIGLSAGTAFNDTAGWLKFYVGPNADCNKDGVAKVLFIAKKTLRNDLSWDDIYLAGAVYGTGDNGTANASTGTSETQDAQVTYSGYTFKVRLLTGSATDPAAEGYNNQQCSDDAGAGSEWNDLLYRVHLDAPDCGDPTIGMPGGSETERHGGPQDGANWANFTNADLQVYYSDAGDGTFCWCQEQGNDISRRVRRGFSGVPFFYAKTAGTTGANAGWRPVLELIQS